MQEAPPREDAPPQHDDEQDPPDDGSRALHGRIVTLLVSILLISLCGIVYELIVATVSSYFLGNSVLEFSLTIGLFMSAMGLGSFVSRFFRRNLLGAFLTVEILIGLVGGLAGPMLFAVFALEDELFRVAQVATCIAIGMLVGLEIPLLTRYLRQFTALRVALASVLSWDYIGALVGSLAFPILLLPTLGLIGASLSVGLVNLAVALAAIYVMRKELARPWAYATGAGLVALALVGMLFGARGLEHYLDRQLYRDQIIYSEQTPYQKLVVTRWRDDVRLFIDGNIQFSSVDEYRYHEALVHVPMAMVTRPRAVLILGGGDGLAVREVRKWGEVVERIVLVDLDPAMTRLGAELAPLVELNGGAFEDPRLEVYNQDAMNWLEDNTDRFDVVLIDLPDPNHEALSKLYSRSFYQLVRARLADGGVMVTQSTSPYYSRRAFWCIHRTLEAAFCPVEPDEEGRCPVDGQVLAYHVNVPNFGDWGFNVAATSRLPPPEQLRIPVETSFLDQGLLPGLFAFPRDEAEVDVEINRLIDPVLLHYYLDDWTQWNL